MDENVSEIAIVDYGRGMQLSTKRITVQDLVPYFQGGSSYGEIIRWIPCLLDEEIAIAEQYYRDHQREFDEAEARIREQQGKGRNPDWFEAILRDGRRKRLLIMERLRDQRVNGVPS